MVNSFSFGLPRNVEVLKSPDPRNISIDDFTYPLPEDRIANYPLKERDSSKLLIYNKGSISEDVYSNIAYHIPKGSLLVFNDTQVIEARILFQKSTGGMIEIFCLYPHHQYADITAAMNQQDKVLWHCLIGGASKWKPGQLLSKDFEYAGKVYSLSVHYIKKQAHDFLLELSWNASGITFSEILHLAGAIPLPPYIKRAADTMDAIRYQTIYAHEPGSVAAPTAGLHFTDAVFEQLTQRDISKEFITLHVGAGTFKPVVADRLGKHEMHEEFFSVTKQTIQNILAKINEPIIAVGTTSFRTLESLYWLGADINKNNDPQKIINQWQPYGKDPKLTAAQSLEKLLNWMEKKDLSTLNAVTQILIAPGYSSRITNALITNFHQPRSTLLLLVAAMIGDDWKKVYAYALANEYRFLSYGDGSLLWFKGYGESQYPVFPQMR